MTLTCPTCKRVQPLTDEDVVAFHPRFFCLTCGERLPIEIPEARLQELRRANDRARTLSAAEAKPADGPRRVVQRGAGESSGG